MPSTPLPHSVPSHVQHMDNIVNAYNMLLRLEKTILADIDSSANKTERGEAECSLMYCRIIGHFFHHVPTDMGLDNIVLDVTSTAENKQQLLDLGKLYFNALRVFRSAKDRTPVQSHYSTPPSFETVADLIKAKLEEAPQIHQTAKNSALVRDGFKCVISGAYDVQVMIQCKKLIDDAERRPAVTKCVHIFPEPTYVGFSEGSSKADSAASDWAVLSRFVGRENLLNELDGHQVHRLENVMTMECTAHFLFDSFDLWLELADVEDEYRNQYHVKGRVPLFLRQYPKVVEFSTIDPVNFPLPSRDYLALHAACAKVAHLSAAAEYIDSMFKNMEEMLVLSTDGTSAGVLEHAIWASQRKLFPSSPPPRYQEEKESVLKYDDESKLVVVS